MKKQLFIVGTLVCLYANVSLFAQEKNKKQVKESKVLLDEVVVTDSRFNLKKENSGKVVHKITSKTIEKSKGKNVVDLINSVSGIEINGSYGQAGQQLGYYIRGGRSKEVVVLIDGVQVSDPLGYAYDLRLLDLSQVESIEIIKGASSTLYGSGASSGVINITLKKHAKDIVKTVLEASVGTNNTQISENGSVIQATANVSGKSNKFNYLVGFGAFSSQGISAAKSKDESVTFKDDPFQRFNTNVKLGYDFTDNFKLSTFSTYNKYENNYDGGAFSDFENYSESKNYRIGLSPEYVYEKGSINVNLTYNKFDIDRTQTQYPGKSMSESYVVNAFAKHKIKNFQFLLGVDYQNNFIETYAIPFGQTELTKTVFVEEPKASIIDPYFNTVYISDFGLNINAGLRLNNHNKYGSHLVYNVNPSYRIKNKNGYMKFFGTYGTAFVAPSLQNLYGSYGNVDLKPQESTTLEGGVSYKFKGLEVNGTYFQRDIENLISYDPVTFKSANRGDDKIEGVEVDAVYKFFSDLALSANYTFTENENIAVRIPKHKINAVVNYTLKENTSFLLDYQIVSDRDDTDFSTGEIVVLEKYSIMNFTTNHNLNKNVGLFFNVNNLFNEDFQEVLGYSTRGRNYRLGVRFQF